MSKARTLALETAAAVSGKILLRGAAQTMLFNAIRLNRRELSDVVASEELRFIAYCLSRRERSRSQIMQDLWVCYELGEKKGGFFVEFGATDGLTNSNTCLLEKELGWSGILAEPNPVWHQALAANRTAAVEHRCVSSRSGETVTFITTDDTDPELSAIEAFADQDHFADTRRGSDRIRLETLSLDDLLRSYQAPQEIDYLSMDTEGSELDILNAFSFGHTFKLISVEHNETTEPELDRLLGSKGYRRVLRRLSQWDAWYVTADLPSRRSRTIFAPTA